MFENISLVLRLGWFTGGSWVIVFQKGSFKFMLWLMEDCLRLWWLTGIGRIVAFQGDILTLGYVIIIGELFEIRMIDINKLERCFWKVF